MPLLAVTWVRGLPALKTLMRAADVFAPRADFDRARLVWAVFDRAALTLEVFADMLLDEFRADLCDFAEA